MKILILCPRWGHAGGAEQYLISLVEQMTIRDHTCCVVYTELTDKTVTTGPAANVIKYNIPSITKFETSMDKEYANILALILDKEEPDVIFLSELRNFRLLRLLLDYGQVVAMAHDYWLFCLRRVRTLYFSKKVCRQKLGPRCLLHGCFLRKTSGSSSRIIHYNSLLKLKRLANIYREIACNIVASNYVKDVFLQHGFVREQVEVLPLFTALPSVSYAHHTSREGNILFVGRMDRYKGVDYLLRALTKVRAMFTCTVIGDGPLLSKYQQLSRQLGLADVVRFLGWISHEKIEEYRQVASLVAVPSIWPEPFGIVGIEAMASAKPVVAFDSGGISQWLQDGETGYLVPPKDVDGMAQKIEYLLRNPGIGRHLGRVGRRLAEAKYNKEVYFERLTNVFERVSKKMSR
ncbi:MAG: glycosyltransferase family 4 protein [Candidatus Hodarchaeales archaeon]